MGRPIGDESDQEESRQSNPYRLEIIVPEVPRAGTYRTEPAIDYDFFEPEGVEF